jgi:hypothetical protein
MAMKLGKPKYEQNTKNYFAFKKDQNTFILRVLPPMGDLADEGKWSVYHRVEFGHVDSDGRMKPFLSPRVVNYNKMVEVESESHVRREKLKTQEAAAKDAGNKALQEQCYTMLRKYNQDAKHYMNAIDLNGNIGLFKIGHRGFQALKAEIEKLRSTGVDPVGIENGRFFVFSRSGKGRDTIYTVVEYKEKAEMLAADGTKVMGDIEKPHAINEAIMGKLATDAFELNKVYPAVTAEEESRIIAEGPTAVDAILGSKKPTDTTANSASTTSAAPVTTTAQADTTTAQPETALLTKTDTEPVSVNLQTGEIQEPATSGYSAPVETAAETAPLTETSEEDFFKKIESGNF